MKNETFLIPANSKRGLLIFNVFTSLDLIIFGSGIFTTVFLIMIYSPPGLLETILVLLPALITGLLVTPVPNYHNVLLVLIEAYTYFTERQNFIWKGWQFYGEEENKKV